MGVRAALRKGGRDAPVSSKMTDKPILDHAKQWMDRAEEVRRHAEEMRDSDTKRMMLNIAEGYERLAKRAAERAAKK